jgi:3-deoxy-manno-octulosonate cytidylyltransferase (CMP-KDO synthetase)
LPGKGLLEIAGKPMICWVVERALAARNVSRAIVATDDERIIEAVKSAGYEAVMTGAHHQSGTDRIAEVAVSIEDADLIVNVQGD